MLESKALAVRQNNSLHAAGADGPRPEFGRFGDRSAHQIGFVIGSGRIFFIAWLTAPWLEADTFKAQFKVGGLWLVLIVAFELGLGYVHGFSWETMLSDYNLARGGLMPFGLVVLLLAPAFGARLRARGKNPQKPCSSGPR